MVIMRWLRYILFALFLLCTTVNVTASAAQANPAQASTARFDRAACDFKLGTGMEEGHNVYCGYLVVPEDHARPDGPTILLAVAVFKSPVEKPAPAPLIFLQGGPGGAIVEDLGSSITGENAAKIVGDQDLILIDQRGNGLSHPYLGCKPLRDLVVSFLDQRPSQSSAEEAYVRAARGCYTTFTRGGVDLNTFNTIANAADIAELGPALGYKQVNVYGVSYGTRVALTMMRAFPANIRSVIIDAVLPNQVNTFTQVPVSMSRVFKVLFAGCAADKACNAAYPHLDRTFYDLVDHLNAKPATIEAKDPQTGKPTKVRLTGDRLVNIVFQMLYVTANIPYIPKLIHETAQAHYSAVAAEVYPTLTDVVEYGSGISEGTYNSVACGEDAPFITEQQITSAIGKMQPALQSSARGSQFSGYNTCMQVWHVARVPEVQKVAVRSSIPTLVLNGEYDPITPPDLGDLAAKTLRRGNSYTFPGVGHGAYLSADCPHSMAVAFLANPTRRPDASCIKHMTGPKWVVTPNGQH
jgi:pimeloyl-ACP methyl ester carboxylesterase